jgi:hypothetical protein
MIQKVKEISIPLMDYVPIGRKDSVKISEEYFVRYG